MLTFFKTALDNLPVVATSGYALAAYIVTLAASVLIAWRVKRTSTLLHHIDKFPKSHRLAALETEVGGVRLARGLSPEQWLLAQRRQYLFIGTMIVTILVVLLFLLAGIGVGKVETSVSLNEPGEALPSLPNNPLTTATDSASTNSNGEPPNLKLHTGDNNPVASEPSPRSSEGVLTIPARPSGIKTPRSHSPFEDGGPDRELYTGVANPVRGRSDSQLKYA